MNLKLKQLYLNRVEDDPVYDEEPALSEPQSPPGPSRVDLLRAVVILVLVGIVVWLVVVSWMDPVSA